MDIRDRNASLRENESNRAYNGGGCGCGCGGSRGGGNDRDSGSSPEKGCGCGSASGKNCGGLMHQLQMLDFSLGETVLYLNSYPNSCEALNFYQDLLEKRKSVAQQYEKQCGPLTAFGSGNAYKWNWTQEPWPWEHNFPGNSLR